MFLRIAGAYTVVYLYTLLGIFANGFL